LTKEEIEAHKLGRDKQERFDLGGLLARNQGLSNEPINAPETTPMINGYKMLKETPMIRKSDEDSSINSSFAFGSQSNSSKFKLPVTPLREELGHKIANEAQIRKREQKAKDKFNHYSKIGLAMRA